MERFQQFHRLLTSFDCLSIYGSGPLHSPLDSQEVSPPFHVCCFTPQQRSREKDDVLMSSGLPPTGPMMTLSSAEGNPQPLNTAGSFVPRLVSLATGEGGPQQGPQKVHVKV